MRHQRKSLEKRFNRYRIDEEIVAISKIYSLKYAKSGKRFLR